jgi:cobalt-zinc-cadmium efflux system outer membrane protein
MPSLLARLAPAGLLVAAACATHPPPRTTPERLEQRTGVPPRTDFSAGPAIPPGVNFDDGVSLEEAVATALWNDPEFLVQLTDLGFARADLLEAGLLRNPVLSLLLPVGPKQLEATLRWPIEILWERPRRVAVARVASERVAAGLEQAGLDLVADVKTAFADLALAQERAALAAQAASELDQIDKLTQSRLSAGDIGELEARAAAIDAARANQEAARAGLDVTLRLNALRARLGLALDNRVIAITAAAPPPAACGPLPALLEEALASRPDVRAAELAIEEAGRRLGWERARVLALAAALDANSGGTEGFEIGPGFEAALPLFDRNQGGRARAAAEMERAARVYAGVRQRVATELRNATAVFDQAAATLAAWRGTVLTPLETQVQAAERAYAAGDVSYLFVLETTRRLTGARLTLREAEADLARALARTERAVGRRCGSGRQEITRGF